MLRAIWSYDEEWTYSCFISVFSCLRAYFYGWAIVLFCNISVFRIAVLSLVINKLLHTFYIWYEWMFTNFFDGDPLLKICCEAVIEKVYAVCWESFRVRRRLLSLDYGLSNLFLCFSCINPWWFSGEHFNYTTTEAPKIRRFITSLLLDHFWCLPVETRICRCFMFLKVAVLDPVDK